MLRTLTLFCLCLLSAALGGTLMWDRLGRPRAPETDLGSIITAIHEVARLEALEVTLHRKIDFRPQPPPSRSGWDAVLDWARARLHPPRGRVLVFARIHMGLDLEQLDLNHLHRTGDALEIVLPPIVSQVELLPAETEVIDSNLDSTDTAQLLEAARLAFAEQVRTDTALQGRARRAVKQALQVLLARLGYREVRFVGSLGDEQGRAAFPSSSAGHKAVAG